MLNFRQIRTVALCAVAASALILSGCTTSEKDSANKVDTATSVMATAASSAVKDAGDKMSKEDISFDDAFVRAMESDAKMTAVFGKITNNTDNEITIVGFETDIDAGSFELHEVVDGKMQEKQGGFVIPAGKSHVLEPGHDHFMVMDVSKPVAAGETVNLSVELSDGSMVDFKDIPVRTVAAGDEEYSSDHSDHGDHDHSEHKH
ncbi:hypothetical protein CMUST_08825 [Corynebacterium mustelae]|uniref:Copper chaperone PCu(A)C n=1 Tax=Corynebacterium mustelae TaxID=571915 RepID=A0A0G3GY55_9CORY|nr:copper chaperone PCu(A)C [Corynebacterium mustelae]AKK06089.1 hypothetical protein CMUST_08825 [Corynebacterium mustelae]